VKPERDIYRRVYQHLWRHPAFRALSEGEKVLALYLVTGPQTNLIGCYRFSPALAAEDLGISTVQVKKRMSTILAAFDWTFDEGSQWLWIQSWFRWNPPNGIHQKKSWQNAISGLPNGKPRDALTELVNGKNGNPILREQ